MQGRVAQPPANWDLNLFQRSDTVLTSSFDIIRRQATPRSPPTHDSWGDAGALWGSFDNRLRFSSVASFTPCFQGKRKTSVAFWLPVHTRLEHFENAKVARREVSGHMRML